MKTIIVYGVEIDFNKIYNKLYNKDSDFREYVDDESPSKEKLINLKFNNFIIHGEINKVNVIFGLLSDDKHYFRRLSIPLEDIRKYDILLKDTCMTEKCLSTIKCKLCDTCEDHCKCNMCIRQICDERTTCEFCYQCNAHCYCYKCQNCSSNFICSICYMCGLHCKCNNLF